MRLQIERHRAGELPAALEQQMLGAPAGARDGAARVLQRRKERVTHERIVAGEAVPVVGAHAFERIDHMYFDIAIQEASSLGDPKRGAVDSFNGARREGPILAQVEKMRRPLWREGSPQSGALGDNAANSTRSRSPCRGFST